MGGHPGFSQMEEPARTTGAVGEPSIAARGLAPLVLAGPCIWLDPGCPPPRPQGTRVLHTAWQRPWGRLVMCKRERERRVTRRWGVDTQVYTHMYTRVHTHCHTHACGDARR